MHVSALDTASASASTSHAAHAAPASWRRAASFGTVGALIGVGGHWLAWGGGFDVSLLLTCTLALTALARLCTWHRPRFSTMLAALAAAQLVIHALCMYLTATHPFAHEHLARHIMPADVPPMPGMQQAPGLMHDSLLAMIAVHVIAVLIGAVVLYRLEQRAWRTARHATATIVRVVARLITAIWARPVHRAPAHLHHHMRGLREAPRESTWRAGACATRGPPVLRASAL